MQAYSWSRLGCESKNHLLASGLVGRRWSDVRRDDVFAGALVFVHVSGEVSILCRDALARIRIWKFAKLLKEYGSFYIVNFAAAGGILGVHYLLQDSGEIWSGIWYSASGGLSFSIKIGAFFILVCFFVVLFWFKRVIAARQRQERIHSFLAEMEVRIGDTTIACTGLIDTGNQLTDPLSRLPVTVMEASLWERVLPHRIGGSWLTSVRTTSSWS